jgi:Fe-S-cluster containining protein
MPRNRTKRKKTLAEQYPPSDPCACEACLGFCARPGWWTVEEAARAIEAGYGSRMMLEMAPDHSFGVLSPSFKGNEVNFAQDRFADRGCTFLKENLCELYGTGLQPLECRFCHHDRPGLGPQCHAALEKDWRTPAGQALVVRWSKLTGFWDRMVYLVESQKTG